MPIAKRTTITVSDLAGKRIAEQTITETETIVALTEKSPGIYILKVEGEGKTAFRKLIVE